MIRVCMECRKELSRDSREPVSAVTHTYCPECKEKALKEVERYEKCIGTSSKTAR